MPPLRRFVVTACWAAVAVAYVAAILPHDEAPTLGGSDKLDHMAAFFTISLLGRLGYQGISTGRILGLAAAFGALIEVSQMVPFIHRDAQFGDWVADVAASLLGLLAAWPLLSWWRRRVT